MATYVTPLPGPGPTGPKPALRMVNRSPSLLRNGSCNLKSNAAKRKSAVELLQESKAFYVKSEQVLDSKQELKHSEHLQVTANPNFDVLLKTPVRVSHSWEGGHHHPQPPPPPTRKSTNVSHNTQVIQNGTGNTHHHQSLHQQLQLHEGLITQNTEHSIIITPKVQQQQQHHHQQQQQLTNFNHVIHEGIPTCALNSQGPSLPVVPARTVQPLAEVTKGNSAPGLPPKSPRSLRPRSKTQPEAHSVALAHQCFQLGSQNQRPEYRRSHSERDTSDDFQIRLRRLLNTDSKENLDMVVCPHPTPATFNCVEPSPAIPLKTCPVAVPCRATTTTAPATSSSTSIHKSMPDLSPLKLRQGLRRPQGSTSTTSTSSSASTREHPNTVTVVTAETPAVTTTPVLTNPPQVTPSSASKVISNSSGWSVALDHANRNSIRRPILRSKSDISHRYSKSGPDLTQCGASRSSRSLADLERFFDKMGLDGGAFYQLHAGPSDSSPPVFFNSVSSLSSSCCKAGGTSEEESTATSPQGHATTAKEVLAQKEGLTNENLSHHGPVETSIVERNARVIKWLYNCRKAS